MMERSRTNLQDSSLLAKRRHKNSQNNNLPARRYATNLPRRVTDGLSGTGLSTSTTRTVKTVNAIYHLINKDWGKQTIQTIASCGKRWTVHRIDNSHYVPASQRDFYTLLHALELTQVSGKDFSFTQIDIPGDHSRLTSVIKITNEMPVGPSHSLLDGFLGNIYYQIASEVNKDVDKWSFRKEEGGVIHLEPELNGPAGLSTRLAGSDIATSKEYDMGLHIDFQEADSKIWSFWIHETAVTETWEHVFEKARNYANGSKYHVTFISILKMDEGNGSRIDLSIWRVTREERPNGRHKPKIDALLDRTEVYPNPPNTPIKITISKHDIVSWRRDQKQLFLDITMEITIDKVYKIAKTAADAMERKNKHLPSSPPDEAQLPPSSPPGYMDDEEVYQDEEVSEKGASQPQSMLLRTRQEGGDDPSNLIDNNSQKDSEEDLVSKDTSGDGGFEKDEEVEGRGILHVGDAGRVDPLQK